MSRVSQTCLILMVLVPILIGRPVQAIESQKRELQWAYIMNFIHYISWPNARITPVVGVCVVGTNPFAASEGDVNLNDKTGSITVTHHYSKMPEMAVLSHCDLIYFAQDISLAQLSFVLSQLTELPILTMGDHRGFNKVGGLLQFIERGKNLGFRFNKTQLNSMKLKIHPSLMRLSE